MDVSVVMPVYNVREYIKDSVMSIMRQSFTGNMELILVNDGTRDDSVEIALSLLKNQDRLEYQIINKENGGLPSARNAGINKARGKYICFIDSDDMIGENHIQNLHELITKNNLPLAYTDFEYTYLNNKEGLYSENHGSEIIDRKTLLNGFIRRTLKIHCCAIMFDRELINSKDTWFNEKLTYGEDIEFMWRLFPTIPNIGHVKQNSYKYLQRPNSIMTYQSKDKIITLCDEFKRVANNNKETYPDDNDVFEYLLGKAMLAFIKTAAETSSLKVFYSLLSSLDYKLEIGKLRYFNDLRIKSIAWILYLSPFQFYCIANLFKKRVK